MTTSYGLCKLCGASGQHYCTGAKLKRETEIYTDEEEAREIVGEHIKTDYRKGLERSIAKALQKKQDRIEELEKRLEIEKKDCKIWAQSAIRLENKKSYLELQLSGKTGFCVECEKKAKRLDELESALKRLYEFVESPVAKLTAESLNEFIEAKESAKKALGYTQGAEG